MCAEDTDHETLKDTEMHFSWKIISCEKNQYILHNINYVTCNKQNFSHTDSKKCQIYASS